MIPEAILAETNASLRRIALCGVKMVMALPAAIPLTAQGAAKLHRKMYRYSMKRTIAFAVKRTANRLVDVNLEKLDSLLKQNDAAFSPLFARQPNRMSNHARRDVLLQAMTWAWTKEILKAAIEKHPDMHMNE